MAKIYLVNVGANTADGDKARSPVWPDGRFEFVSFPYPTASGSYGAHLHPYIRRPTLKTHADPDLENLTYGDYCGNPRAAALINAAPGDILLFWALLWRLKDNDVWNAWDRGWYLVGAIRVAHVLRSGERISSLPRAAQARASCNAHVGAGRVEKRNKVRVFIGDTRFSARLSSAVDLGIYRSRSLLRRFLGTKANQRIEWNRSPRWNSVTRTCRAVLDLDDSSELKRAEYVRDTIRRFNPTYDMLAKIRIKRRSAVL